MAGLSSSAIVGFISSGIKMGEKIVEFFLSGFSGYGWKIWEYVKGKWMLEIDAIRVRGQFTVFELLVSKIRAIIGAQTITQGCGKIKTVQMSEDGTAYLVTLEEQDMSFMEHDFIRCQEFTGNQRLYHVEIESIVDGVIRIPVSEFESEVNEDGVTFVTNPPIVGDDIVQFGNSSYETQYAGRHSAIYMHADENAQPAIDVLAGIYSKDWSNCLKVRVGGDIPGTNGLKGFYCVNGMLKGVDDDGTILYQFNPDSSGFIAKGNIRWDKEGNGDIFNRAIYWDTDGFHFGSGVKLTWDNLDSEVKKNLKGEPGKDGSSLVYKGEFTSHPSNPQNGWYYRNTSDKKNYVYQDNAWYVMTVDGEDGLDGINGNDRKDGLDIVWKGDLSAAPADPVKNWVYRDTDNGRVYIYNGTAWELMVADGLDGTDGTNGKDGMRVYITYHDSETEPAVPTGNGTTEGWHTNSTASVVWISQKVADSADSGEWGTPIRFRGKDGQDANLLPWIEEWNNNKTEIGGEYMVSPKMFSGTKDSNGKLTGVAMGRDCLTGADGTKRTGIFALVDDEVVFELDPVNKKYKFKGEVFANKGTFTGTVNANDGVIGGFEIEGSGLKNISGRDAMISVQTDYGDHQRQAALGNTLSAMVGFDVSAYMSATGNWNSFNRALMLRASGSTMRKDMMFGGYCNLCIDAIGGVDWKMDKNDHWSMPGVLGFVAVERDLNSVQRWGDGMIISRIQRTSTGQYTLYHSQGHTDYIVIVQTTPWAVDGDRWTIGIECGRYNDHFNIQTLDANKGLMNIDFRVVVIGRPAD